MLNSEIVVTATEGNAAHFDHAQSASLSAIIESNLFEQDYAVGNRVELEVICVSGQIVQQQNRALSSHEEMLESQDLPEAAQRNLRDEPSLGQAGEHDTSRISLGQLLKNHSRCLAEFHLGGMEQGHLLVWSVHGVGGHKLEDRHTHH